MTSWKKPMFLLFIIAGFSCSSDQTENTRRYSEDTVKTRQSSEREDKIVDVDNLKIEEYYVTKSLMKLHAKTETLTNDGRPIMLKSGAIIKVDEKLDYDGQPAYAITFRCRETTNITEWDCGYQHRVLLMKDLNSQNIRLASYDEIGRYMDGE